jgi:uncharacterized protein (TIGR02145 family)
MKVKNTIWLYPIIILGTFLIISGSCKKDESDDLTETVTDFDGNVYHKVKIGTQMWLVENLKVTHFNNGDPIPPVMDSAIWFNMTSPGYCDYDYNEANGDTYGHLYNLYAVNDARKIAPPGWHIPSDAEWTTLINYLGGVDVAGGKMKTLGTTHWVAPNTGATNSSGFSALPGGINKGFQGLNRSAYFWSSSDPIATTSWCRHLNCDYTWVQRLSGDAFMGMSVRCVMD